MRVIVDVKLQGLEPMRQLQQFIQVENVMFLVCGSSRVPVFEMALPFFESFLLSFRVEDGGAK
jgi:hypothetical protein